MVLRTITGVQGTLNLHSGLADPALDILPHNNAINVLNNVTSHAPGLNLPGLHTAGTSIILEHIFNTANNGNQFKQNILSSLSDVTLIFPRGQLMQIDTATQHMISSMIAFPPLLLHTQMKF